MVAEGRDDGQAQRPGYQWERPGVPNEVLNVNKIDALVMENVREMGFPLWVLQHAFIERA